MENRSAANHRPQDATTLTTEWPTPDAQHKLRPFRCLITAGVIGGSVKRGTGHTSEASQPIVTCLVGPAANQKVPRQHERCSPDRAFVDWVHVGVGRAAEGLREIVQVLKRPDHPGDDNIYITTVIVLFCYYYYYHHHKHQHHHRYYYYYWQSEHKVPRKTRDEMR